jgi:Iodothyronine deiodinase
VSALNDLFREHGEEVQFLVVYIREAHAADSRRPDRETRVLTPTTLDERAEVAETCVESLGLELPLLLDEMEDGTEAAYDSWPDRLFLVDADGNLAWKSGHGPWGFDVQALEQALEELLGE